MSANDFGFEGNPIGKNGEPSPKTQEAFETFLTGKFGESRTVLRTVPKKLFVVSQPKNTSLQNYVERQYLLPDLENPENFRQGDYTSFSNGFDSLRLHGESFSTEVSRVYVSEQLRLTLGLKEEGRRLLLLPDSEGNINSFDLDDDRDITDSRTTIYLQKGLPFDKYDKKSATRWTAVSDKDDIVIERFKGGLKLDSVRIPRKINPKQIIGEIFSSRLLEDPINADPTLDSSWRNPERIKQAFGIKWEKIVPPPIKAPELHS